MEMIAQIFGMTFVGIILACLIWTVCSYIAAESSSNKKLLDNMENLDKDKKEYEPMNNGSKYYK